MISPKIGFVSARIAGDLDVTDQGEMGFDLASQIAAHDLAVIKVELKEQVGDPHPFDERRCLIRPRQEIPGHVAIVDRLDQQANAGQGQTGGGVAQVGDVSGFSWQPVPAPAMA